MARLRFTMFCLCLLALGNAGAADSDRHVVVISIDGLPGELMRDPNFKMPVLRHLERDGASCNHMRVCLPTVTRANHASMVTGVRPVRHGVHSNNLLRRTDHRPVELSLAGGFTKDQIVAVPTVYDRAFAAGLSTAAVGWPVSGGARSWTWTFAPAKDQFTLEKHSTTNLLNELKILRMPVKLNSLWSSQLWRGSRQRDQLLTDVSCHLLERKRPNLLFTYLSSVDLWQHRHGAHCDRAYEMGAYCDRQIQRIVDSIAQVGLGDKTTIVVVSDHGFASLESYLYPNFLLREEGLLALAVGKASTARARASTQGGCSLVYVEDKEGKAEVVARIKRLFSEREQIVEVVDYQAGAKGRPIGNPAFAPDLFLVAKPGFVFADEWTVKSFVLKSGQPYGVHGFHPDDPKMFGYFMASGRGIKRGVQLERMEIVDLAPTLAALLGLELPDVDGRVLEEILSDLNVAKSVP